MRLIAAWFGNPAEYWVNILGLIVVAIGVFIIRKVQAARKTKG